MKYYVTMNKNGIKVFLFFLFISNLIFGQSNFVSPLSFSGFGMPANKGLSADLGFGGANTGFSDPGLINIANPATYHFLFYQQVDLGFLAQSSNINLPSGNFATSGGRIRSFFYGFSLGKRFGFVLGLKPYSSTNYEVYETSSPNTSTFISNYYLGEGGFNDAIIGIGYKLYKDSLNIISIGSNLNYLFGNQSNFQYSTISEAGSSNFNTKYVSQLKISDIYLDFGLHYMRKLSKDLSFGFGATYQPSQSLNSNNLSLFNSFAGSPGNEIPKDTISFSTDTGSSTLPQSLGLGLSFEIGKGLIINADYKFTAFSTAKIISKNLNNSDRSEFSLGVQYIPNVEDVTKLLSVIKYRLGARVVNTGINYDGGSVSEFGITFGLGLPLLKSQSFTSINIGAEIGGRNNGNIGTYSEQFNNFYIGISISPHKFDRWFVRRKID